MTTPEHGEFLALQVHEKLLEIDLPQETPRHPFINSMVAMHLEFVTHSTQSLSDTAALLRIFEGLLRQEALLVELRISLEVSDQMSTEELANSLAVALRDIRHKDGWGQLKALLRLHSKPSTSGVASTGSAS